MVVHEEHDYVDRFSAYLETERSTAEAIKRRSAPAPTGATGYDSLSIFSAEAEAGFHHCRNYADAFGMREDILRNAFIGGAGYLIENVAGLLQALLKPCTVAFVLREAESTKQNQTGEAQDFLSQYVFLCMAREVDLHLWSCRA
jgi:hypothetical protein